MGNPYVARAVALSEREFQEQVIEYAKLCGWKLHAERPARTKDSWRTPVQGDPGWPDIVAVRDGRLIFAELKTDSPRSKVTAAQQEWLDALGSAAGLSSQVYVWRPSDWVDIEWVLR